MAALSGVALLAACSAADDGAQGSDDELSLPAWVALQSADWGCGEGVTGSLSRTDAGHGYAVEGKKGTRYTFRFKGSHDASRGTVLAVYEKKSKRRVEFTARTAGNQAEVTFTPPADGDYVVGAYTRLRTGASDYSLKQFCEIVGQNELTAGQAQFSGFEMPERIFFRGGPMLESAKGSDRAPSGRTAPVEEADVYKIDGSTLYYLNTYRGLLVYDIANPKAPRLLSRAPVFGYPVEMFVQNGVVYALVKDALEMSVKKGSQLELVRKNTSQLVSIDVSNLSAPRVLEKIDIVGELREGLSRKVGDVVYVVSEIPQWYAYGWSRDTEKKPEQAWVYSFNVANPADVKQVQKLQIFEGGSVNDQGEGNALSKSFAGVTISATPNALMIVENWNTYSSVWGSGYSCGTSESLQQAKVSIVDISSPQGAIKLHTSFETYGHLGDQFKQTYVYDARARKGTYFGVFARREWAQTNCTGAMRVENAVEAWDVTSGANPQRLGKLAFGKPNETVRGSAFDADRGVLFAITAEQRDPLYAISLTNPRQMKVLSAVDGLSGDMSLFRFIGGNKFLLAIGTDTSDTCTGFGSNATGWSSNVAASIIDVQDTSKVRLVQRKCVTIKDAQWIGSEVNFNLDQAHKMIGLYSDQLVNLVSVPVHYTKKTANAGGWDDYKSETAVGMLGWDLTKYDPTKDEKSQTVLDTLSTVIHPAGQVKRSVIFNHAATASRKMLNLSSTHASIVDIDDVRAPVTDAVVEVAPYKDQIFRFGGHVVEQVQPTSDYGWDPSATTEFRVKALGPNVDDAPVVAKFALAGVQRALVHGDHLVAFTEKSSTVNGVWSSEILANVFDMSSPWAPRKVGAVKLPLDYVAYPRFRGGVSSYWFAFGDAADMAATEDGFVFLTSTWDPKGSQSVRKLVTLDLRNPNAPRAGEKVLSSDATTTFLGLLPTDGDEIYLSQKAAGAERDFEGTTFREVKFSAQRYAQTGTQVAAQGAPVSLPGKLVGTFTQGNVRLFVAHDQVYDRLRRGGFGTNTRLSLVTLQPSGLARLEDKKPFLGYRTQDVIVDGARMYLNLAERSEWRGGPIMPFMRIMPIAYGPDELRIFDLWQKKLSETFATTLGSQSMEMMGAAQGRLFVNLPGDGVLMLDVTDPARPSARAFVRTLGYTTGFETSSTHALVAAGFYGVHQVSLASQM
jgi:hypothetical protein